MGRLDANDFIRWNMADYEIAISEIEPQDVLAMTYTTDINHVDIAVPIFDACTTAGIEPVRLEPPLPRRS